MICGSVKEVFGGRVLVVNWQNGAYEFTYMDSCITLDYRLDSEKHLGISSNSAASKNSRG